MGGEFTYPKMEPFGVDPQPNESFPKQLYENAICQEMDSSLYPYRVPTAERARMPRVFRFLGHGSLGKG